MRSPRSSGRGHRGPAVHHVNLARHAWCDKSDKPATMLFVLIGANARSSSSRDRWRNRGCDAWARA